MTRVPQLLSRSGSRINVAIEGLWLVGLLLVPLVFRGREWVAFYSQPKFVILHGVALAIAVLWITEVAIKWRDGQSQDSRSLFDRLDGWLTGGAQRWAVISVVGFGIAFFASTLLSPLPWVSVWGRDFGDQGYELYSTLSYLVIFGAIALRLRSREQLDRLLMVIIGVAVVTSLYGIGQHFGWDPIGRGAGLGRVISTFGNPLHFGSFLVIVGPITLAWGVAGYSKDRRLVIALATLALAVQLAALWYAGGRGPWLGSVFGLVAYIAMSGAWMPRKTAIAGLVSAVTAAVIALLIISSPGGNLDSGRGLARLGDIFSETADTLAFLSSRFNDAGNTSPTAGLDRSREPIPAKYAGAAPFAIQAASIVSFGIEDDRSLALSGRADIWRAVLELTWTRDRIPPESGLVRGLRVLFGYGPDMLFYSYPITAGANESIKAVSHAHNYGLQVLAEQGLVGLLLLVAILVLVVYEAVRRLRGHGREERDWRDIFQIGVLAALVARTVEQGSGVGRVSDLMLFWALVGLSIALVEMRRSADPAVTSRTATRRSRRRKSELTQADMRRVGVYATSAIAGILALVVFVQHDINPLRGGWTAANAFEQKAQGNANDGLASFKDAAELAPDVERYRTEIAGLLSRTASARTDPLEIDSLLLAARAELLRFEEREPYAWQTQIDLAAVTSQLVANGHDELNEELAARYFNVSDLMPAFRDIQSIAAEQIVLAGAYDSGFIVANRAIALEAATQGDARAWWARGEAAYQLGLTGDALLSFETSLTRGNVGRYAVASHRGLAFLAEEAGDSEESAERHAKADALDR